MIFRRRRKHLVDRTTILTAIPASLRDELFEAFDAITTNFAQNRFEPSALNGGKLCEVTYTILKGFIDGAYPAAASKPPNMVQACLQLEQAPSATVPRSVRIQIPRILMGLYEIRNNRGVGHVGGDVDPNLMDATCVLFMSKWIVAELIRIYHGISTAEAQEIVNAIVQRISPKIWEIDGKRRVLDHSLSYKDKTMLLLYHGPVTPSESDLCASLEHSNPSVYRRDILKPLHKKRLIEYTANKVSISPLGIEYVESELL